jgi:hypothetical protein
MASDQRFIELRLPCAGLRYVAVLGRRSSEFGFQRCFNPFRFTRIRLSDGSKEEIHHLPDEDFVHEIQRVENGKLVCQYLATVNGDPNLHRISRRGAEVYASRIQTLRQVIEEYPERPSLADFKDEED